MILKHTPGIKTPRPVTSKYNPGSFWADGPHLRRHVASLERHVSLKAHFELLPKTQGNGAL